MKDDDKSFVNRHGHRANLNQIDLSDMSIDDEPTTADPTPLTPQKTNASRSWNWNKRKTWITVGIVAVILLLPVIAGEIIALRYTNGANSVHGRIAELIKTKVMPMQKTQNSKTTIKDITTEVDNIRAGLCAGGFTDNLAMLYPRAKAAHETCVRKAEQLSNLANNLKKMDDEDRYMTALNAAMTSVTGPASDEFAVISAQLENWQQIKDKISKMNAPNEWKAQHTELVGQITITADAWSALNNAQNNQDKAGFENSEKTLTSSYEAIRAAVNALLGQLNQTQSALTNTRKALQV